MKKYNGYIKTNKVGSTSVFEFEAPDDLSDDELEQLAKEYAFELISWNFEEVN